jgi:hypothetical protein
MTLTDNQIKEIADLASDLTPISEIAVLMDLNEDELRVQLSFKGSPARLAYLKAKAKTAHELRKQEIEFARSGSPLAVQLTGAYLRDMTANEEF